MISLPDIEAATDVVDQLINEADALGAGDAIRLRTVVDLLANHAKLCSELLEARALTAMDGQPVKVGDQTWVADPSGKWRANHTQIKQRIVEAARLDEDGQRIGNVVRATKRAVDLTYALFVSPADFPKQKALPEIHATNKTIGKWEAGRNRLKLVDTTKDPEA